MLVAIFAASNADTIDASCGDYLHGPDRDARSAEDLRVPLINAEGGKVEQQSPSESSIPHCSGPFCQQSPSLPFHRSPADPRLLPEEEAHIRLPLERNCDEQWSLLGRSSDLPLSAPDRSRLDRPPQAD